MAVVQQNIPAAVPRILTRADYYKMGESGELDPNRKTELIEGAIYTMAPIGPFHADVSNRLSYLLRSKLDESYTVRHDSPIVLSDLSEPQPDIAVARGPRSLYAKQHPSANDVLLVIEVSDTTLKSDRDEKLPLYARAAIPEYWIVNLFEMQVEVYRDPDGDTYKSRLTIGPGDHVDSSAIADLRLNVAHFLSEED